MRLIKSASVLALLLSAVMIMRSQAGSPLAESARQTAEQKIIQLPEPRPDGPTSVEKALNQRQSVRSYLKQPLSLRDISQLIWAAQGITRKTENLPGRWNPKYEWQGGYRTAPSAGALYPLELYLVAGNVEGLESGVYKYLPRNHSLKRVMDGDRRTDIFSVALRQPSVQEAAALIVLTAVYERTSYKYGERAPRYVHMEAGAAAENVSLQGVSLGIGTVIIGAFQDADLKKVLQLPADENPLIILPLGKMEHK
ncbi:MAG: SagB/ThcOx family dehydrogenase [Candidatus Saccharicenans sp.]|nr:SagB/ThcOx family dehydrogenase [Candidatus Saccharicenans sp.]